MFERGDVVWWLGRKHVVGLVWSALVISDSGLVMPKRSVKPIYRNGIKVKV